SIGQLDAFGQIAPHDSSVGVRVNVGSTLDRGPLRIDPDYRFGLLADELPLAVETARRHGLHIVGAHAYFGTGLMTIEPLLDGFQRLARAAADAFPELAYLDVGGGFGVPDSIDEPELDLTGWGERAAAIMAGLDAELGRDITLYVEPGRYLAAGCG